MFRGLEQGEEETGTIQPGQLPSAMRSLGLNPSEQEVIDIPNYITRHIEDTREHQFGHP